MNSAKNNDAHERARRLIASADPEALSAADRLSERLSDGSSSNAWLAAHLETCAPCRAFAENAAEAIHRLRAIPAAAGRSLVSTTQIMVRRRALELQRHRERMWTVAVATTAVTLCALLSTIVLWRGFEWIGAQAQLAPLVWQAGFLVFCVMPALLAALLLLAKDKDKDKHLADHTGSYRG